MFMFISGLFWVSFRHTKRKRNNKNGRIQTMNEDVISFKKWWPFHCYVGVEPKIVVPQNGWWKSWKTLLKWMIWGYHYFWKHPCWFSGVYFCLFHTTISQTVFLFGQRIFSNSVSPPRKRSSPGDMTSRTLAPCYCLVAEKMLHVFWAKNSSRPFTAGWEFLQICGC